MRRAPKYIKDFYMLKSRLAAGLVPYVPGEQPKGGKVIKLNTNENPYPPSPKAIAAAKDYDFSRLRLYPDPTAVLLRETVASTEGVKTENVFVGNGSDEVLSLAFAAFFDSSSSPVLFPDVTYSFYKVFCSLYGIAYDEVAVSDDFTVRISDYLDREISGIALANPNAPTALSLKRDAFVALAEAYPDKVIIIDEAYVDFSSQKSLVPLTKKYKNILVVKTFSKSRSLAGGRIGYAIGDVGLIDTLRSVKDCFNSYTVDSLSASIARASMLDEAYFAECVEKIKSVRAYAAFELVSLGFRVTDSDANFLFAAHEKKSGRELQSALRERGIIVRRFDSPRIADYLRITVGTREETETLVSALREILARA